MTQTELMADVLNRNLEMVKMTVADFSDAEMLVRPVPSANHAAWQLGHLINSEAHMVNAIKPGSVPAPAGYSDKFTKETAKIDDPKFFPKKAELLDALAKVRTASIAWVKTLTSADMDRPGPERMKDFAPTAGHVAAMLPVHATMHMGQFQVIRRKLGRPVMF